ncbi:hypothetical protein CO662_13390 [Rhizobium anhuiense]|uniref:DUF4037 domain-containing protein n=1 Tax=Rhizobium anhuiense TaxID=1184720 RepID=A0ABX4J891_9HYPH|nr:DUF4037 domain-containing protein [Rhizobium anhuiense]PDS45515.1 hypothetical protein CO668_07635 [Rhizobium anhuiense]PDS51456.1 hypothetical protein CO662_13390 [Rhizobium anhuiense]
MQGIELSRGFYTDIVRPWLSEAAPELRYSAALIGYGSELIGFDDEVSKDHNWGPRVHILLSRDDFGNCARRLVDEFSKFAPADYLGEPIGWRSRPHPASNSVEAAGALGHGLEFHTLEALLEGHFAVRSVENLNALQWLGFAEQKLLAFTSGAVFHDDDSRLSQARDRLGYFPEDVWLYKIACQWRRIAEEQAFVGRAGQVGDDLGSRVIAARLVRDVMRMGFLLERRYAPYSKWLGSSFARLPIAEALSPHLKRALHSNAWTEREDALAWAYLELAHRQNAIGIASFEPIVGPYHDRPFTTINADDAVETTCSAIADASIRQLPIVGSLDQVSDLTPLLEDAKLSQRMMSQLRS